MSLRPLTTGSIRPPRLEKPGGVSNEAARKSKLSPVRGKTVNEMTWIKFIAKRNKKVQ